MRRQLWAILAVMLLLFSWLSIREKWDFWIPIWSEPSPDLDCADLMYHGIEMETAQAHSREGAPITMSGEAFVRPLVARLSSEEGTYLLEDNVNFSKRTSHSQSLSLNRSAEAQIFFIRKADIVGHLPVSETELERLQEAIQLVVDSQFEGLPVIVVDREIYETSGSDLVLFGADRLDLTDAVSEVFLKLQTN